MYVIKNDHEHIDDLDCHPRKSEESIDKIQLSQVKSERKIKIQKIPIQKQYQYMNSDALTQDLA